MRIGKEGRECTCNNGDEMRPSAEENGLVGDTIGKTGSNAGF